MKIVRLRGELGKLFGREHRLDVRTPSEAVRALCIMLPGFREHLALSGQRNVGYKCTVDREIADEDRIAMPMARTFEITPVICGAGKVFKIILGVALIAAAFIIAPPVVGALGPTLGMGTGIGFLGLTYANIAWLGVAITLAGVAQMLVPTPKINRGETNENRYFDGAMNTTAQGGAVPIGYGRAIVGSAVISAGVSIEDNWNQFGGADFMPGFGGINF